MTRSDQVIKITLAQNFVLVKAATILEVFALKARKNPHVWKGMLRFLDSPVVVIQFNHIHPVRVKPVTGQRRMVRDAVGVDPSGQGMPHIIDRVS